MRLRQDAQAEGDGREGCAPFTSHQCERLRHEVQARIGGKHAITFGHGEAGKGSEFALRGSDARGWSSEIDQIRALQACMIGVQVTTLET